jgi:hypothetical protein
VVVTPDRFRSRTKPNLAKHTVAAAAAALPALRAGRMDQGVVLRSE